MSHRDAGAICEKIDAALHFMGDDDESRQYLLYQLEEIMGGRRHITMDDCTNAELTAILAVVLPVFARGLTGIGASAASPPGKLLTLVFGGPPVDDGAPTGTD